MLQAPYLVSASAWDTLFALPNGNAVEHRRAWTPVARVLATALERLPENATDDQVRQALGNLGPAGNEIGPAFGVSSMVVRVAGGGRSAFVTVGATKRTPGGDSRTRQAALLLVQNGRRVQPTVVTPEMPAGGRMIYDGTAVRRGSWILVGGCDWSRQINQFRGAAVGAAFRYEGGRWRVAARRTSDESGLAKAVASPNGWIGFETTIYRQGGQAVRLAYPTEAFVYHERWQVSPSGIRVSPRTIEPNEFWAMDHFVSALQKGDRGKARQFATNDDVIDVALASGMDLKGGMWSANGEGDYGGTGYQLNYTDPNGKWHSVSLRFKKESGRTLISKITRYR